MFSCNFNDSSEETLQNSLTSQIEESSFFCPQGTQSEADKDQCGGKESSRDNAENNNTKQNKFNLCLLYTLFLIISIIMK